MLTVQNLDFEYPGVRALKNVSFSVPRGSITAVVGPNGAGKTTLLRCIAALDEPLSGRIVLDGVDVQEEPRLCHQSLGYLSDFFGLYEDLTVERCLHYTALAHAIPDERRRATITTAATRVDLGDRLGQKAGALSRGLRQRLAIAQAIIHEPKMLLLDEPASGLDPEARSALAGLFRSLRDQGMTLLVSSHILAELEEYSTDMLILQAGELVGQRSIRAPEAAAIPLHVLLSAPFPKLASFLAGIDGVSDVRTDGNGCRFRFSGGVDGRRLLLKMLVDAGAPVYAFGEARADMQREYLDAVKQARTNAEVRP
jgi:ABC-2 type transport system ATP-binding protein